MCSISVAGFPSIMTKRVPDIVRFCAPIRKALAAVPKSVRIIAEPGRFIAGPCAVGVASVMGRAERGGLWWYYLDDGVYGFLQRPALRPRQLSDREPARRGRPEAVVLAGPTCDSIDVIAENILLPRLKMGDLLVGRANGCLHLASASEFNFFPRATVVSVNETLGDAGKVEDYAHGFPHHRPAAGLRCGVFTAADHFAVARHVAQASRHRLGRAFHPAAAQRPA